MDYTQLFNNFTGGEICEDAWERTDLQPVQHGFAPGSLNVIARVQGPAAKRRGFWLNGTVNNQAVMGRIVPFVKSLDDALLLEFGDSVMRIWQADGSLLMSGDSPFIMDTPFSAAQCQTLRWKQDADVIYFFSSDGMQPQSLSRASNTSWSFAPLTYKNGPWMAENTVLANTVTVGFVSGPSEIDDEDTATGAAVILAGATVTLTANTNLFVPQHVGAFFRLRQSTGSPGVESWAPDTKFTGGQFLLSNSYVYLAGESHYGAEIVTGTTPPVHNQGTASDGNVSMQFLHDGAGFVQVTSYTSATEVTCAVVDAIPLGNGQSTSCYAEGAYSAYRGWPTMWPSIREERLVTGATATNLDYVDMTQTAGFTPTQLDYTPGTGTGLVIDTNAVRRRDGDDGGMLVWATNTTYLAVGSQTAEYIDAGSVLDEPISPSAVIDKKLSMFGVADAAPVLPWDEVHYITAGGQNVRALMIDTGQGKLTRDLTILARHIAEMGFVELAWVKQPDDVLWARLANGGLAAFAYQKEQQVEGWTTMQLGGGFVVEWMGVMPGEDQFATLWLQVSRVVNGVTQRCLWMQSQKADKLFYDGASLYSGTAVSTIDGLDLYDGELVGCIANGAEQPQATVESGAISVPATTTQAQVGLPYTFNWISLRLDVPVPGGALNLLKRPTEAYVRIRTAGCSVGQEGFKLEYVNPRTAADVPGVSEKPYQKHVTFAGDSQRDPRIQVTDTTGFDCVIYSIQAKTSFNA